MELSTLLAQRRMVRSFDGTPVDLDWLERLCATALWAPSAGNSAGVRMHTIAHELVPEYFEVATDESWRTSARRARGLQRAGAVVLVTTRPQDYLARYTESDKAASGLGDEQAWPVPYWHTDAAMATMALLLLIEEDGWQATLWGNFRHGDEVLNWAHISGESLFGAVLVGRGDGNDAPSASLQRRVPTRAQRVGRVAPSSS
ncbi:MAG: nitroreductase family protein [Acidimicrobiales bacterium]